MSEEKEPSEEMETVGMPAVDESEAAPKGEGTMGVLDHLEELRWAVFKSIGGIMLGVLITAVFFVPFFSVLKYPLERALSADAPELVALTTTSVVGVFIVIVQVCLIGGIATGLPFVLYHFARFVAPGLTEKEKRALVPACICTMLLFILGCLFSYFVVLPTGIAFSLQLNNALGLSLIWTAQSYYNLVIWMMIGVGLAFEFPLVMVILQYIGLVTPQKLREIRRTMALGMLIGAALITPGGDPVTLILLTAVLYVFYELSILVGERLVKKREDDLDAYFNDEDDQ
ncbi:MAG: twin-arginine translocase subunit TatC [Verrucomicrobiota bacterium]